VGAAPAANHPCHRRGRRPSDLLRGYRRRPGRQAEVEPVNVIDVIITKRDGAPLSDEQIDWVVAAYTRGEVADEQMAALAMAILLRGMTPGEIARWTAAMIASGERLDLST